MSLGCGTLAHPHAYRTGNLAASSSNGKQHTLPLNPAHEPFDKLAITKHWTQEQTKGPSRLWGTASQSRFGGEERPDASPENWLTGDFWNVDSNINIWGPHEIKRNAASASHDVHRHDQIQRVCLPALPGQDPKFGKRQCVSGVVGADCCFLEAWGFSLGCRDRQAQPTGLWKPVGQAEFFRSGRSYSRNLNRMTQNYRSMRRSRTEPGKIMPEGTIKLKAEDTGGEAGDLSIPEDHELHQMGRTHGSRSCRFWDQYDHAPRREAAKMSCSIHSPSFMSSRDHPIKEGELNPASVYTLKYRKFGEESLRKHYTPEERTLDGTVGSLLKTNRKTMKLTTNSSAISVAGRG